MSVPAFGFSAGDFIAAVGLAVNVTNALKDVGGASEQYRILVQELNSLERVVRKLHARQGTENSFPEDITKQTDMTLETLGSFLKTISKFNSKLGPNAASGWHHGVGRKAQWAVAYAKEVEKLRVKLGTHLAQLNMLLQIYASARVEALAKTLASIPPAIEAQDTQMLALQQETSTNIDNLGSQIQQFGSSQEAILHRQHSVVLARFQAARDDIQQGHGHITTLGGSIDAQTQQLAALRQDAQVYHSTIRSRIEEAHQHTQQGMQLLSRQSDLILYAVSQPGRTESMRAEGKDDVFFLLFQLLRAISKSMGNLLWKAGLILPFILSAVERMTNTIRRQPYLLVEDSINFTDMQGKKYTMHYDYFRHWSARETNRKGTLWPMFTMWTCEKQAADTAKIYTELNALKQRVTVCEEHIRATQDTGKSLHDLYKAIDGKIGAPVKRTTDLENAVDEHNKKLKSNNSHASATKALDKARQVDVAVENLDTQLKDEHPHLAITGFADDTNLLVFGRNPEAHVRQLEAAWETCIRWADSRGMKFAPEKSELIHFNKGRRQWTEQVNLANPGGGTSPVKPEGSARFLGVWLDWKLNWKAHLVAVEKKLRTQSYALSRIVAKTWGMGLAKAREVYTKCIRSALAYGASSFHIPTDVGGEPAKKGITKALGKAQNKSLRIVAGAFKSTPIRNLETETWVPPLDLYLNKRLADFENRLQRPDLDDGRGGKKTAASVVLTACRKIQQRLSSRRGNKSRPRTLGPQGPTAVERAAGTVMRWTGGTVDTNRVVEEAWKARWLKERDGRAITRPADDFDHQQETLFRNETLRRHDGLSKAKSSLLIQIRTGAIGLRDFLFTRGVPEVLTPACECGEGRETAEHLVVWCLAPPLTRRWERTGIRTRRDFYSVLHGINPTTARLARRVLDWLMDSGKLPMYNLARRPPLFVYVGSLKRIAP
ncbi:hypothetical protein CHGG_11048 [Chaetomium globosum CBS 148.51]|uniref:Fungal N-terminal domain-containing protein n=1 Tax=Chaetomium globosum (strain ATCC 6205 / CBS 148.51 / DSM 1962 / NBRC 6347 / NRRL 1970) TaxID=306901 RepID=Q2GM08_CHAGB|nr:uncharacterized protein CHGG_11048 [Chaetomium globosum CBS 148.51]EAQ82872.1 hypothetical protein CHGG_11048 [Chaetomium globosum CBS 148.51]